MIHEVSAILFPKECIYHDIEGYADLTSDASKIASVDFSTEYSLKGTKSYISIVGEIDETVVAAKTAAVVKVEIIDKDTTEILGTTQLSAIDLSGGKECRIPFFADKGDLNYTLKVTTTLSKGGLYATLKHEVG